MQNAREQNESRYEGSIEGTPVPKIQWEAPKLIEYELGEITRTAKHFAENPEDQVDITLRIYKALSQGNFEELPEEIWKRLENTDSYEITPGDFNKVREQCEINGRNFIFHKQRLMSGNPIPAPTIAIYDGIPHKIGGNTRLMFARALGIRPKVVIARLEKREAATELRGIDIERFEDSIEFYQFIQECQNLETFQKEVARLPAQYNTEQKRLGMRLADLYYATETPPTLEEFIKKAHKVGII